MSKKRVQILLNENDYEIIKMISSLEKRPVSDIIREATKTYIKSRKKIQDYFATNSQVKKAFEESIRKFHDVYKILDD